MKTMINLRGLLALIVLAAAVSVPRAAIAQILVGSGANSSYLVIEGFDQPLIYEYRYDTSNPFDGYFLLTAVDQAQSDIAFSYLVFGTPEDPSYFLNAVTYQGQTLTSTEFPLFGPFWAQWVSGGKAGFPEADPIPSGTWVFGSGISTPYREIQPNSWDGYVFNLGTAPPSVSPVPEPHAALLVGCSIMALLLIARCRRHACDEPHA